MVMAVTVLHGVGATLREKAKWRVGEHQGEVGELTVVILVEEEHWVALSTCEVEDAEEGARRCGDGGLGLARSWLKWVSGCSEKAWVKATGEWRSIARELLGGGAHSGNGYGGLVFACSRFKQKGGR